MECGQPFFTCSDLREIPFTHAPDDDLRTLVLIVEVCLDRRDEFGHAAEAEVTAAESVQDITSAEVSPDARECLIVLG